MVKLYEALAKAPRQVGCPESLRLCTEWVIFDVSPLDAHGGWTYYSGNDDASGEYWHPDKARAVRFATVEDAQATIEECDPEEWLRDRLVILPSVR